jgi:UDP-N-acetylglucosamine/UDP-N-acetylgalactosamine diphosphorylase
MEQLRQLLARHKQQRLLAYLEGADPQVARRLSEQLATISLDEFFEIVGSATESTTRLPDNLTPHPVMRRDELDVATLRTLGERAIRDGELAFMVVAGGQGSRLGFEHPKGMFPIGVVSEASLFQIHCEKIVAFGRYYGFTPHLFVMTSRLNRDETEMFLRQHQFFGLTEGSVHLFEQGDLPAVDAGDELILSERDALFWAPDGHGGALKALRTSGMIERMRSLGVRYLSYFQVDNPLVDVCCPLFLGAHIREGAEVSTKVIRKRSPLEKLGNPVFMEGRAQVVEYSDLPRELAERQDSNGDIVFAFGSIGIHLFDVSFIESITTASLRLPYHVARKAIPFFNPATGAVETPREPNGRKFEQFVFDAIPMAAKSLFFETERDDEFAPLKNRDGEDSIASCRAGQSYRFKRWLARAGFDVSGVREIEIAPSFAVCEEEFAAKIRGAVLVLAERMLVK